MSDQASTFDFALDGRTALVTGASSGLGVAIAAALGRGGAQVAIVGRDSDRLSSTAEAVRTAGGQALELVEDLASPGAPQRIADATASEFGSIDILVNNAGIFTFGGFGDYAEEQVDAMLNVNVKAPFELTQAALKHMGEGSSIVFVGSNLAYYGRSQLALYAASKGAIESLARTLAVELGPRGIRVNTVSPGATKTPMTARLEEPGPLAEELALIPLGRVGEPEDVAAAVCFLASESMARYVAGATLLLDGGTTAS